MRLRLMWARAFVRLSWSRILCGRVMREMHVLKNLSHPNIISMHESVEKGSKLYLVLIMPLVAVLCLSRPCLVVNDSMRVEAVIECDWKQSCTTTAWQRGRCRRSLPVSL